MTTPERAALAAIVYMDLSHLPVEQRIALYRQWALDALDGKEGPYLVKTTPEFEEQWRRIKTPDTADY